jgi:hypothetical protein
VRAGDLTRLTFEAGCRVAEQSVPRPAAPPPSFTDGDLARRLDPPSRGVLYLWSPHMPLSVDGYAEVARAASARGLAVEPLLDPQANRDFAAATAAARGLPASALRVVDAVELQFRELSLHAPSAAVFAGGRLVGEPLRGYRTADEYATFFSRLLDGR